MGSGKLPMPRYLLQRGAAMLIILLLIPVFIGLLVLGMGVNQTGIPEAVIAQQVQSGIDAMQAIKCAGAFLVVSTFFGAIGNLAFSERPQVFGGVYRYVPSAMPIANTRQTTPEIDVNGSYIGYRYFEKINGELWSVGAGIVQGRNPITNRDSGNYAGGWNISDRVPTLKNKKGIYAAKTRDSHILQSYNHEGAVLAKVELSGRVIEGEYGYRAQYCRVLEVYDGHR